MSFYNKCIRSLVFMLPPEMAHRLAIFVLKSFSFCFPEYKQESYPVTLCGKTFCNPLGLAAGFDKDADAISGLSNLGLGFVELGTVTPEQQKGNPRPRIFRDEKTKSVINRMGFPGAGVKKFKSNLQKNSPFSLPIGVNIGKNKATEGLEAICNDYAICLNETADFADYFVVNVSSPNTPGLRDLQTKEALTTLLSGLIEKKPKSTPLLVKIAPDLDSSQLKEIAEVLINTKCDGVVISNTTLSRPDILPSEFSSEQGGLSGELLKDKSTDMIREFYKLTAGKIPIIGVGGVSSGKDIYDKMRAGASLVQLYTAFIFEGPPLVPRILKEFGDILKKEGIDNCKDIIGIDSRDGLS